MARTSNANNSLSIWKRIFTSGSKWENKDEFLDIIYWGRQILSIIMGLIWAHLGLTGSFGILSFIVVNSAAVYVYSIQVNEDNDDAITAVKEGFMTAFASFLVTWILVYTHLYF